MCGAEVPPGHSAHRGLVINEIASLNSKLITAREQLATLQKKRHSKQFREQQVRDMATIAMLKERIDADEHMLSVLRLIDEKHYGSGHQPSR